MRLMMDGARRSCVKRRSCSIVSSVVGASAASALFERPGASLQVEILSRRARRGVEEKKAHRGRRRPGARRRVVERGLGDRRERPPIGEHRDRLQSAVRPPPREHAREPPRAGVRAHALEHAPLGAHVDERGPVLIRDPEAPVGERGQPFRIDARRVKGQHVPIEGDWNFPGAPLARWMWQAGERRAVLAGEGDRRYADEYLAAPREPADVWAERRHRERLLRGVRYVEVRPAIGEQVEVAGRARVRRERRAVAAMVDGDARVGEENLAWRDIYSRKCAPSPYCCRYPIPHMRSRSLQPSSNDLVKSII